MMEHIRQIQGRRSFIQDAFCGFGSLAMAALLQQETLRAATSNPLSRMAFLVRDIRASVDALRAEGVA